MDTGHKETEASIIGLGDVGTEPHSLTSCDLCSRNALNLFNGGIQVANRTSTDDIAQVLDSFHRPLRVFRTGIINQTDVLAQVHTHVALVELVRSDLTIAMEVPLIITPLPVKAYGRLSQADNKNLPHISQNLATLSIDFLSACTASNGLAKTKSTNVEHCTQTRVHGTRIG